MDDKFIKQVQMVFYLVSKFGKQGVPVIKAVKLMFLSDVYAVRKYGDFMTEDTYYAMKNGPVGSEIDNILEQNNEFLGSVKKLNYVKKYLEIDNTKNSWSVVSAIDNKEEDATDYLSEWDEEIIDYIFNKYGNKSPQELIETTHRYNMWKKGADRLTESKKRVKIQIEDILENDGDISVSGEDINLSRKVYGEV